MRRIATGLAVGVTGLTAAGIAVAQITSGVPSAQPRTGTPANVFAPGWSAAAVALGSNGLENPVGDWSRYGYVMDGGSRADGLDTKSEADQNTYLTTAGNPGGPTAGYDYGHHFLIQGHEIFSGADGCAPGVPIKKAYFTRVNLDVADPAHRITLLSNPSVPTGCGGTTGVASIDGSTYDPWTKELLFTAEDGANGGVVATPMSWASTAIPATTNYFGSMGQGGYEGIHNDDRGNVMIIEDVGGSGVTDNGSVTKVKQPNSFVYRFKPKSPGDLTTGKLQALQVKVDGTPISFHSAATTSVAAARDDALGEPIRRLHSGERLAAAWVTIHDTDTDGTAPFNANAAAKAAGATPLKRPENGKFVPGTDFRSFVFGETGDTDQGAGTFVASDGAKAADRGAWGALIRIDMPEAGADTATVKTVVDGDAQHAAFDNVAFLDDHTVLLAEDRGDSLHKQLGFLDSLWSFDLTQPLDNITTSARRLEAQGRDADSFADVQKKEGTPVVADHNDGDNEVTGIHVSDGSPAIGGILGTNDPSEQAGTRIFVTQQHGSNITYELTPPAAVDPDRGPQGEPGAPGANGSNGANGANGSNGANGAPGAGGAPGANGANGPQGAPGATGATGPAGPSGSVAVTCKVTTPKKVTCTVSSVRSSRRAGARLVRSGRTVARGTLTRGRGTLTARHRLVKGSYTLVTGRRAIRLVVR